MGEAKERRLAEALAREEARRAEWADEMVADASALLEASHRHAASTWPGSQATDEFKSYVVSLAALAAQRAIAADLVDALSDPADDADDDDEPKSPPAPKKPASTPLSLVTPKLADVVPPK